MADKKLLEESVIARFQRLANIAPSEKSVLKESAMQAGGRAPVTNAGQSTAANPVRVNEKKQKKNWEESLEEEVDSMEENLAEAEDEMDLGGDAAMGGDMEGGDIKAAFEKLVGAFNEFAEQIPELSDLEVATEESGEEDAGEDMGGEEEAPEADMEAGAGEEEGAMFEAKEEDKDDKKKEEMEESIELVDDALLEKLVQRVSARLVSEARKTRELAEAKKAKAGNWLAKPGHAKPPKGHGAGKGKKSTPFTGGKK